MKEWSTTTEIAQLLGKPVRRIQQLTQEGILETKVPPGGGARRYNTRETMQRYRDTAEKLDARKIDDAKKITGHTGHNATENTPNCPACDGRIYKRNGNTEKH